MMFIKIQSALWITPKSPSSQKIETGECLLVQEQPRLQIDARYLTIPWLKKRKMRGLRRSQLRMLIY